MIELLKYKCESNVPNNWNYQNPHQFLLIIHRQKQPNVTLNLNQVNWNTIPNRQVYKTKFKNFTGNAFRERLVSGSGKVCKAIPYIYVCVCARAHAYACLFFKIIKIENLAMLDKILPHEILYAMPNLQHNNTAKSS